MPPIQISLINASTVLKSSDLAPVVTALQTQISRDFAPIWGTAAQLALTTRPTPKSWWLGLFDDSDQAGALGYHDLTSEGLPLGKVFVKTSLQYAPTWTTTASHELLEMLADPDVNLSVFAQDSATSGTLYGYEVCDACQASQYAYKINGVLVSDFVYPAWFQSFRKARSTQFDYAKKITKPFQLLPGGYIGIFKVGSGSGWQQLTAEKIAGALHPHPCHCFSKRVLPISSRLPSQI